MIITKTPLRIELLGGGTDIDYFYEKYPGRVLNVAIDKYIYITIKERLDGNIKFIHESIEVFDFIEKIKHSRLREVLRYLKLKNGVDIISISDIHSKGSGLGSSSSFVVGLINGLAYLNEKKLTKKCLAEMACHLEIDILKEPIGKQDQYAATFGGLNLMNFSKGGNVKIKSFSRDIGTDLNEYILVFNTGINRSASKILNNQKENFSEKFQILKNMADLTLSASLALESEDFQLFARLLSEEWSVKKGLAKGITNKTLDNMYDDAMKAGAWGGRISGAGGGGFLVLIANPKNHEKIKDALNKFEQLPVKLVGEGSEVFEF